MHQTKSKSPFYKRWQFYLTATGVLISALILLLITSVLILRWVNPSATSFTLRENWSVLETERYNLNDWWVPADEIPEHIKWAVIASEDQLFRSHRGFDSESIREAWQERQTGERNRGASTISQQVAKNIFLTSNPSFFRKGLEAGITILIELFWPKERIMEVYLNIAEFGPGVFGIGKAADTFFDLPASRIEPEMAARLASVLPNPKRMRVEPPSPFTIERSQWVLRQMEQLSGNQYIEKEKEPEFITDPFILDPLIGLDLTLPIHFDTLRDTIPSDEIMINIDLPDSLLIQRDPDGLYVPVDTLQK